MRSTYGKYRRKLARNSDRHLGSSKARRDCSIRPPNGGRGTKVLVLTLYCPQRVRDRTNCRCSEECSTRLSVTLTAASAFASLPASLDFIDRSVRKKFSIGNPSLRKWPRWICTGRHVGHRDLKCCVLFHPSLTEDVLRHVFPARFRSAEADPAQEKPASVGMRMIG